MGWRCCIGSIVTFEHVYNILTDWVQYHERSTSKNGTIQPLLLCKVSISRTDLQ